jgi:hypothetical protein
MPLSVALPSYAPSALETSTRSLRPPQVPLPIVMGSWCVSHNFGWMRWSVMCRSISAEHRSVPCWTSLWRPASMWMMNSPSRFDGQPEKRSSRGLGSLVALFTAESMVFLKGIRFGLLTCQQSNARWFKASRRPGQQMQHPQSRVRTDNILRNTGHHQVMMSWIRKQSQQVDQTAGRSWGRCPWLSRSRSMGRRPGPSGATCTRNNRQGDLPWWSGASQRAGPRQTSDGRVPDAPTDSGNTAGILQYFCR